MATMNAPMTDRRHLAERRASVSKGSAKMSALDWIAMVLLIVGGLNWAMVGLFNVDVVASIFGIQSPGSRLVYVLVGLAALYSIYFSTRLATSTKGPASRPV